VEDLAARLGLGDRHLRRLFAEQLGASPLAVAHTRRVHFAKRLIEETRLPMTQIAFAAGYHNVRRFNAAVRNSFERTPTAIRRGAHSPNAVGNGRALTLRLPYREPFDWNSLIGFLEPRAIPGVERVDGNLYRRTVEIDDFTGAVEITPDPQAGAALLLRVPVGAAPYLAHMSDCARRLLDLSADPGPICDQLSDDPRLAALTKRFPGVRVPGAWERFELVVRAVLGQQVTVAGATRLAGRLVRRFGRPMTTAGESDPAWLFPRPADLAAADIAAIGIPAARAETIRSLAKAVRDGEPILELASGLDEAIERLVALPGVGEWTAHYVAMRALGEPDAFPAGDLGLRKALARGGRLPTASVFRKSAETWRPWRAYAAMLLWRESAVTRKET
jgi:AraC family transcriptional regulator of adaptative response / DNA-3-methyladenine glycosylase II